MVEISLNFHRFIQACEKCRIIYCVLKEDDPINELEEEKSVLLRTYEGHLESKERFAIKKYLLIIGKKKYMQVLSHTFTYFST